MKGPGEDAEALLPRVLDGHPEATEAFAAQLLPLIHRAVGRCLLRVRAPAHGDAREITRDLVQQVFVALLENDRRVLRQWDPRRGRGLAGFVVLVAEREVWSVLRRSGRNPWSEIPIDLVQDDHPSGLTAPPAGPDATTPEEEMVGREMAALLHDTVHRRLGERGLLLLQLLVIEEHPPEEVAVVAGMTTHAVYAWHWRLRQLVHELYRDAAPREEGPGRLRQQRSTR